MLEYVSDLLGLVVSTILFFYETLERSPYSCVINKRQRIPKGQSIMDNLETMALQGTQNKEKHNIIYVGLHYTSK